MITLAAALILSPAVLSETLENGVRVFAIPISGARSFSAQTFVRAGSAYETDSNSGATHLLEHLLFADGEADKVAEYAGFLLDATTFREFMRLHTSGPADQWKEGVDAVALLLRKPMFAAAEKEWNIVRQEDDLAKLDADEAMHRLLWKSRVAGSAWSLPPVGDTAKPVPLGLESIWQSHFVGANVVAVIAGDFDGRAAIEALKVAYKAIPNGARAVPPTLPQWGGSSDAEADGRFAISAPMPGLDRPQDFVAFEIAVTALIAPGKLEPLGLESRAFIAPSEKGSLAVLSFASADGAPGLKIRVGGAMSSGIDETEFQDAKRRVKARYTTESPVNLALMQGLAYLFTTRMIDFAALTDKVTFAAAAAAVKEFAR